MQKLQPDSSTTPAIYQPTSKQLAKDVGVAMFRGAVRGGAGAATLLLIPAILAAHKDGSLSDRNTGIFAGSLGFTGLAQCISAAPDLKRVATDMTELTKRGLNSKHRLTQVGTAAAIAALGIGVSSGAYTLTHSKK